MTSSAFIQVLLYLAVLFMLAYPLAGFMVKRMQAPLSANEQRWFSRFGMLGVDNHGKLSDEMNWKQYAIAILLFNIIGLVALFGLQLLQGILPLNPEKFSAPTWHSAFNTAISFMTNTNWQSYGGESTMSYLTQMLGMSLQNFLSGATGIAVAFALIRGLTRKNAQGIGNAWVDLWRSNLYILLPIAIVITLLLVSQGVIQTLSSTVSVSTLQGAVQNIALGPVASQEAIKMLGTNGGGFFNANSAHPFENPTALSNFIEMLAIFLIPTALCFCLGKISGNLRQGIVILSAMTLLFLGMYWLTVSSELAGNPWLANQVSGLVSPDMSGNMEGKETRFGIVASSLFATITTAASCGAVNAMHDSFTPMGGLAPMLQMQLGEVVFGGVGAGLYGMLLFAILAVFVSGLMIGRTPEYLGKKIEPYEMKMVVLGLLAAPLTVLIGTAISVMTEAGQAGVFNPSAHGFSEILYAFSSAANNNGSAFAGLGANTPFYNVMLGIAMLVGRFGVILPVLALAGSLAKKPRLPVNNGTLPTTTPLFVGLLIGTVLLVGALTFIPALALGPIIEQIWMHQ
ncbi:MULTISPECIES: potassium-transporting ATPase subunit KdpA [Moraxella]|uniref:potassium-transporting ATPase subunit KdpA n=2 Tax=Bacteria TaxID=2 RepID=UPI0019342847|nr:MULTISPECIES: potassium-transporting ATPase subunit KdpA [Moraxella]NPA79222.1 potassium-transporting ATPase subunit KdpA [Gammaproteobacteria bacterium]MBL7666355.1 potassium-transporting ATPase subunit KdpA [Moraxella osloensis]MCK6053597.1 potassium-transporting ATPase subunit KdpA [Moraxella osloensis]MDI4481513.1 potassium-transporting ATPase subunit KdpA [Moraxella osloensis]MDK1671010.1 potassium-transporting ATPase subunit KdpA [Moraxella osloensis]